MTEIQKQLLNLEQLCSEIECKWSDAHKLVSENTPITKLSKGLMALLERDCDFVEIDINRVSGVNLIDSLVEGEVVTVKVSITRHGGIFFGGNLDDLLTSNNGKYCSEIPSKGCLLLDEDWKSWVTCESRQSIHAYQKVVEFIELIKVEVANHAELGKVYLFGKEDRLVIPLVYRAQTLESSAAAILDGLATINSLMNGNSHKKEKAHQLRAILFDALKSSDEDKRFDSLLLSIDSIVKRFVHNHELFVSGFSFDDSRETLQKENRVYTSELNGVINSIYSRVLGIPLGTVLPAFLMKSEAIDASSSTFDFDNLIFISACFLVVVIAFSLIGQYQLLNKVRREYKAKWQRMKTEIPLLEKDLCDEFEDLERSYWLNKSLLVFFCLALVGFFYVPINQYFQV